MHLTALTKENAEQARHWRNERQESLRTPFLLTKEMQEDYYLTHICSRDSRERFWAVNDGKDFIAMVGFVRIEWENHLAEISNICHPAKQHKRMETVDLLLCEGFQNLGFRNIYFEVYHCDPSLEFWQEVIKKYRAYTAEMANRKYWGGSYWHSTYFNITRDNYLLI